MQPAGRLPVHMGRLLLHKGSTMELSVLPGEVGRNSIPAESWCPPTFRRAPRRTVGNGPTAP
jgi:hypothetical protein